MPISWAWPCCSPLLRARQTAEKIARCLSLHARPHPGFLDIDFGAWEALMPDEIRAQGWSEAPDLWFTHIRKTPLFLAVRCCRRYASGRWGRLVRLSNAIVAIR